MKAFKDFLEEIEIHEKPVECPNCGQKWLIKDTEKMMKCPNPDCDYTAENPHYGSAISQVDSRRRGSPGVMGYDANADEGPTGVS